MELQRCYTTLESISCLRGYYYHFRAAAPLPVENTERGMYIRWVKWVYTRGFKGLEYQRFGKGVNPGRPEEAYKVCLTRREPSLSVVVMIYELI